ncbi:MAG: hypothetical protein IT577_22570, partial [Verrucomicrobiae bacterium]|nr:hypothetical protein [Verrucomicrobiae bacterium]
MSRKLPSAPPRWPLVRSLVAALICPLFWASISHAQPAASPPVTDAKPTLSTPTIALHDVRVGMRGYGLTVFHGIKVEPFPVEVDRRDDGLEHRRRDAARQHLAPGHPLAQA